jgi:hypothetical protein
MNESLEDRLRNLIEQARGHIEQLAASAPSSPDEGSQYIRLFSTGFNLGAACAITGDLMVASMARLVAEGMTFEDATEAWLNGVLGSEAMKGSRCKQK